MNDVILACARPYEGQPKDGFNLGKCKLCACDVIYALLIWNP